MRQCCCRRCRGQNVETKAALASDRAFGLCAQAGSRDSQSRNRERLPGYAFAVDTFHPPCVATRLYFRSLLLQPRDEATQMPSDVLQMHFPQLPQSTISPAVPPPAASDPPRHLRHAEALL